ncbi:MAG: hypothetical protein ACREQX_12685 [Candidatus Binataceae bacterium]
MAVSLLSCALFGFGCGGDQQSQPAPPTQVHFVPNSYAFWSNPKNWTTSYGPAYADILLTPTNFVPCRGGPYALCYYSGPNTGSEDLSCKPTADGRYANCQCFDIPYGVYFVDINAILNHDVYVETLAACGSDGSQCQTLNSAPVCQAVNQGTLMPHADLFSTFSFDCVPTNGIGQTNCSQAPYAGCMTAPCYETGTNGIAQCSCPVFNGPYQVGQNDQVCSLGDDLVWSAAYTPAATPSAASSAPSNSSQSGTAPAPGSCLPDAPGGFGCPLYTPGKTVLPPGSNVSCQKVCQEYSTCTQAGGVQTGLTCDATLCTDQCNDRDLVKTACNGLAACDVSEIIKAEEAAHCSCCASQLCGCQIDQQSNALIASLNQQQRARGITPQCDVNGTLCGSSSP